MGSRAAIIIVNDDGTVEQFFDRNAAQTLAQDAALSGFDATLTRIRRMTLIDGESREWAGPLSEGSMLVDIPARRLVWAEEGEGLILPRIMNRLLERTWRGWSAAWSPEGISGINHLLNSDTRSGENAVAVNEIAAPAEVPWFVPCADQLGYAVLSVRLENGSLAVWRTDYGHDDLAHADPDEVLEFARAALRRDARGDGWGVDWWLHREEPSSIFLEAGVHLDVNTRTLAWWSLFERETPEKEFRTYWPRWTIQTLGDAYEWHQQELASGPMQQPWLTQVINAQQRYEAIIAQRYRDNPQLGVLGDETGIEREWSVFDELDRLLEGPPLPPARYVDRRGAIHEPAHIL